MTVSRQLRVLLAVGTCALVAPNANAHFILQQPAATLQQDAQGNPQKTFPCGGAGTATNMVTAYKPGDTVTISVDETVFHPGHYRVALAINDPSELPAEPLVTAGATECGTVPIQDPPQFPILADGQLVHTAAFNGPQTFTVKLPTDVTCTNCTLQVMEFMSDHAAPCFYHHCAAISITPGGDAGVPPGTPSPTPTSSTPPSSTGTPPSTSTPPPSSGDTTSTGGSDAGAKASTPARAGESFDDAGCAASPSNPAGRVTFGLLLAVAAIGLARRHRRAKGASADRH